MTQFIDIGSGINASEILGDMLEEIPQPKTPSIEKISTQKNDVKSVYLDLQKSILQKEFEDFKKGLQEIEGLLTQKQINGLGRDILRNFDQRFAAELKKCQWDELVTADTTIACAHVSPESFHFCLNILTDPERHESVLERHFCNTELREIFARMSHLTESNYKNFNTLRPFVVPHLQLDYKLYALRDVIHLVWQTTPQTLLWNKSLMDDVATLDTKWEDVFANHHPFEVSKEKQLFGPTVFFHRHPKIFEIFTQWHKIQQNQYEQFAKFCLEKVFAVGEATPADQYNLFSQEFKEHYYKEIDAGLAQKKITPSHILADFKNDESSLHHSLKKAIRSFAETNNVATMFNCTFASERLFEHEPMFLNTVLKTPNGLESVQNYALTPYNLEVLANTIQKSHITQQKRLLKDLSSVTDNLGNTVVHVLARKLCQENLSTPHVQNLVLLCMKTNWSTENANGETPEQLFDPPSQEMDNVAKEIFKKHLNSNLTQHLKDNKIKPRKTTERKM